MTWRETFTLAAAALFVCGGVGAVYWPASLIVAGVLLFAVLLLYPTEDET